MSKTNEKYTNEEILSLKEAVQHGDFLLPFDIYRTRMPEYFNDFPMPLASQSLQYRSIAS